VVLSHSYCVIFFAPRATGEQLRKSPDSALAARLTHFGIADVDGLQGNGTWRTRPGNDPPLSSYFIEYGDEAPDPAARGHMGDIAIARPCTPAPRASFTLLAPAPPGGRPPGAPPRIGPPSGGPPGSCSPGQICLPPPPPQTGCPPGQNCSPCEGARVRVGGQCCSRADLAAGGACSNSSCGPGQTAIGPSNFCCNSSQVYTGAGGVQACCSGPVSQAQCQSGNTPVPSCLPSPANLNCGCAAGYIRTGTFCCLASQMTSTGSCCPSGQTPSGPNKNSCQHIPPIPIPGGNQCCAAGFVPTSGGGCCALDLATSTGVCCPVGSAPDPNNRAHCLAQTQAIVKCAAGYTKMPDGSCCNDRYASADGKSCRKRPLPLPAVPPVCPPGKARNREGDCVLLHSVGCPAGEVPGRRGHCVGAKPPSCPPGQVRTPGGECVRRGPAPCPAGMVRSPRGLCIRVGPPIGVPPGGPRLVPRPGLLH
jgi:hypothetical protein